MSDDYEEKIRQEAEYWGRMSQTERTLRPGWFNNPDLYHLLGKEMLEHIALACRPGGRGLDLCCGIGAYAERMAHENMQVDAYDICEERIEQARQRARERGLANCINYQVVDLNHARLPQNYYDSVLSHDAIHHIANLDHLLEQVAGSLKEEAVFVVHEVIGTSQKGREIADRLLACLPEAFRIVRHQEEFSRVVGNRKSPFEEVSSKVLVDSIYRHFEVVSEKTMFAFAPQVFVLQYNWDLSNPQTRALATLIVELDRWLVKNKILRGSSVAILARKPRPQASPQEPPRRREQEPREIEKYREETEYYRQELERVTSSTAYRFGTFFSKKIAWLKRLLR